MTVTANVLLANAASPGPGGVLGVLGLGWRITGPSPLPQFVLMATVHFFGPPEPGGVLLRIELQDQRGEPVRQGPSAEPVVIEARVDPLSQAAERPEGLAPVATLQVEFGAGMLLEAGLYDWVVFIDGQRDERGGQQMYVRSSPEDFPAPPISV